MSLGHLKLDGLVGADLSRTSPIYRSSLVFHDISLILLNYIIGAWFTIDKFSECTYSAKGEE